MKFKEDWAGNRRMKIGWWLMGWPTGIRTPSAIMLRYGPYRLGGMIYDWGARDHDKKWRTKNDRNA